MLKTIQINIIDTLSSAVKIFRQTVFVPLHFLEQDKTIMPRMQTLMSQMQTLMSRMQTIMLKIEA